MAAGKPGWREDAPNTLLDAVNTLSCCKRIDKQHKH